MVFKLKRVEAPLLANMGMDFADIISPTAFMMNPKEFLRNPVGTGPFKFVKWVKDDRIILAKSSTYWDRSGGPYLDQLVFRSIPENSVRFLELKAGGIHICHRTTANLISIFVQFCEGKNETALKYHNKQQTARGKASAHQLSQGARRRGRPASTRYRDPP